MSDNSFMRQCAGKVKHKNLISAEYALNNSTQYQNATIYKCRYCGEFHIGTRIDKKSKTVTKKSKGKNEYKRELRKVKKFRY